MNILLVYPSYLDKKGQPVKYRKALLPPLSLALLDGLTPSHHNVTIVNDLVESIDFSKSYDLVGITAMTLQADRAYQIADAFWKRGTRVIMGGMHPTVLPDEAKQYADATNLIFEPRNISKTQFYESYWRLFQEFYSLEYSRKVNQKLKQFGDFSLGPFFQIYARKKVNSYEHPFSGGIDQIR